jgi:hypothetical protein
VVSENIENSRSPAAFPRPHSKKGNHSFSVVLLRRLSVVAMSSPPGDYSSTQGDQIANTTGILSHYQPRNALMTRLFGFYCLDWNHSTPASFEGRQMCRSHHSNTNKAAKMSTGQDAGVQSRRPPTSQAVNHKTSSESGADDISVRKYPCLVQHAMIMTNEVDTVVEEEEDDNDKELEPTAFISILTPARTLKGRPALTPGGAFNFSLQTSFDEFLALVAKTAASEGHTADVSALNKSKVLWRKEEQYCATMKPLGNLAGFKAMMNAVKTMRNLEKNPEIRLEIAPLSSVKRIVCYHVFFLCFSVFNLLLLLECQRHRPGARTRGSQ